MVTVLEQKPIGEKRIKYTLEANQEELRQLQGHLQGVYFFSPDAPGLPSRVVETGIKGSTKYFTIPNEHVIKRTRKRGSLPASGPFPISCQRFSTEKKDIFVYVLKKA
ncbi:MAG: hypothetical protein Q8R53_03870 [Nanoarchaeota archaeon]|nr:hypothetical protein [Nanoarchaeota archaeon]